MPHCAHLPVFPALPPLRGGLPVNCPVSRWLLGAVAVLVAASLGCTVLLVLRDHGLGESLRHTVIGRAAALAGEVHYDSWRPLLTADAALLADPTAGPYAVFHRGEGKFQYPPVTLLAARALPADVRAEALAEWRGSRLQRWSTWVCRSALGLTLACSALALHRAMRRRSDAVAPAGTAPWLAGLAGILFFPHLIGYQLGQVQVVLNALLAGAVLLYFDERRFGAGVCVGLCSIVKPTYALLLLWSVVRRDGRFTAGGLAVALPAAVASLAVFGWQAHRDYLDVLAVLARQSEIFWFNQSLPGLLHRLLDPAAANTYDHVGSALPDYVAWIHWLGVAGSIAVLGAALVPPRGAGDGAALRRTDFGVMLIAATIASPVAWNHHYGVCFPVMMALLPDLLHSPTARGALTRAFKVAFLSLGFVLFAPEVMLRSAASGMLLSHTYLGGVLLFVVLCVWRSRQAA